MANAKNEEGARCPIEKEERGKRTREGDRALGSTPCRGKGKKKKKYAPGAPEYMNLGRAPLHSQFQKREDEMPCGITPRH